MSERRKENHVWQGVSENVLLLCRQMCTFYMRFFFLSSHRYIVVISVAIGVTSTSNAVYPYRFFCVWMCMRFRGRRDLDFRFSCSLYTHRLSSYIPFFAHIFFFPFSSRKSLFLFNMNFDVKLLFFFHSTWVQVSRYVCIKHE